MNVFSSILLSLLILPVSGFGAPISRIDHDLSKSTEIRIGPGRITVLLFPEAIAEAKVGAPDKLRVVTSVSDGNELTLFWVSGGGFRTNLIVRTVRRTYVFDIQPSVSGHQDLIQIGNVFGSPERVAPEKQGMYGSRQNRSLYRAELK